MWRARHRSTRSRLWEARIVTWLTLQTQLQGGLTVARKGFEESLAIWQKTGDQSSSAYSMSSLGDLLLMNADFDGARKMYEQALAIRTAADDSITIAETQLALVNLALEEAHSPAEQQEVIVRKILDVFEKQKVLDDEIQAWCVLSRGRAHLTAIKANAKAIGYNLVARKATIAH